MWNRKTGKALHNAVVWLDNRTNVTVKQLIEKTPSKNANHFKDKVGLPISPYFSAVKLKWLQDNIPEVLAAGEDLLFGTVDSWLIWNLTRSTTTPGIHVTDVTNASRTMLMDLETLKWDNGMCEFFGVNPTILPEIKSSSEIYGTMSSGPLDGKPICGCLGDQQAALYGQQCLVPGEAKCTYGTGCFLLSNTGNKIVKSKHGLLTTVGYKIGEADPVYALEGAVAIGGEVVRWLRDNLGIIESSKDIEGLAAQVEGSHDVFFVPAFSGLYAPYWDATARGLIIGITAYTTKAHIARASLEAVCFQVCEILESMDADSGVKLTTLKGDGGMTPNKLFVQLQADILGIPIQCSVMSECTALGAGIAAATALGIWNVEQIPGEVYTVHPKLCEEKRLERLGRWKEAVQRSLGWAK